MEYEDNIKEAHVFVNGLEFPIIIFATDEKQHDWLMCLNENFAAMHYTVEELCRWCTAHGMQYRICMYDKDMMNPLRRLRYKRIMRKLRI